VACVFLPYPYHRDEHQRWNAEPLERAGGAVIETDVVKAPANADGAGRAIAGLMRDGARREAMRAALGTMGPADGAAEAARRLLALITS
jgi:UDP-N-acetylglucosamine--N-acetylmuramyl-(pentapeptide) pyrophosphoryl-undecaprenol N-acetylglucosamine transferase